jgi:NADH-quinone oxidoreductase subunit I
MGILGKTATAVKGILTGMGITFHHFVRFDEVITQQYPENRATLRMPARYRGKVMLLRDETGATKCTACGLCVRACPNNSLQVEKERDPETGKFRLRSYVYHFERCTLCGLCVDTCKFSALAMGQSFENAVYERGALTLLLNTPDGVPRPATEEDMKPAPKAEAKPAPKPEAKAEVKAEVKAEPAPEAKPAATAEKEAPPHA